MIDIARRVVRKTRRLVNDAVAARDRREYERPPKPVLSTQQRAFWNENGYLVLPQHFQLDEVRRVNDLIDRLWTEARTDSPIVADIYLETDRERRLHMGDAPADARTSPHKINDLFLEFPEIRAFVLERRLAAVLAEMLGGAPLICNTLNLEFGSQQADHTDSLYMAAPKDLNLVASWIALQDCTLEAGPLRYYPGSHQIPPYLFSHGQIAAVDAEMTAYRAYMARELEERRIEPRVFEARLGDVFIWHSQLYHGGSMIRNRALTRRSIVTHYWRACDVDSWHGRIGAGRYWFKRSHQPVDGPGDHH